MNRDLFHLTRRVTIMAGAVEESVVGQYYDPSRNQLPHGGSTDIHGADSVGRLQRRA